MALPISVNRRLWGWSSQEFSALLPGNKIELVTPIRGLDFNDSASPSPVMAAGEMPYGWADGAYVPGAITITLLSKYARDLGKRVTSDGLYRLSTIDLRLIVKYANDANEDPTVDEIDFRLTELSDSSKQGTSDPRETSAKGVAILIRRNGWII